eukprot:Plantae.Rhodophyta-Hildenbrandia_rubra.ctg2483.p1 GENE.Plantae.Rhodophyta-Hildenbrandia_rubra.ctg2483~~Plantae.Rhodophyta-Hildenbrandia_rubra.ctg2483.p1  ORF type:complete len:405 (-),score=51.22 Plantae.Rhodophyta-Hildenbrandia_rubra.ctg2483:464-1678(-)
MGGALSRSRKPETRRKTSPLHQNASLDFHASPKSTHGQSPSSVLPPGGLPSLRRNRGPRFSKSTASNSRSLDNVESVTPAVKRFPDRPEGSRTPKSIDNEAAKTNMDSDEGGREAGSVTNWASEDQYGLSSEWMIEYSRIQLGKTIGHSSFGTVQEGTLNGTRVAVKTIKLNPKVRTDEELVAFAKEAELNSKLRHPNIVLFMGICVEPKHVCIVTELMVRGNVLDLLVGPVNGRTVKLEWTTRLQWALDTAMGMCYLHSLSPPMIHRDLKTTNLLVDRGMNVKICDFGMSRFKVDDKIMTAVGTVQFAAPEVLKNERYTEKADLFSFGTVLWELHTRSRIFKGLPQIEVYRSVVEAKMPDVPRDCPQRYQKLIKDCWQLDANKRPSFREAIDKLTIIEESMSR